MKKKSSDQAGFHTPFQSLKKIAVKPHAAAKHKAPPAPTPRPLADDERLFHEAMDGVLPLSDRGAVSAPTGHLGPALNEEAEGLAQLAELVSGQGDFNIAGTEEFIEGSAPDVDRRVRTALRQGKFGVHGQLDLHGKTKAEAKDAVERFLTQSQREGKRCVLVVHGRGLNSTDQIPVLKQELQVWLRQGRIGRSVLAFCSAQRHDGGAGALYVLLRRRLT